MVLEGNNLFKGMDAINSRYEESEVLPNVAEGELVVWRKLGGDGEYYDSSESMAESVGTHAQQFTIGAVGGDGDFVAKKIMIKLYTGGGGGEEDTNISIKAVDGDGHPTGDALATCTITSEDTTTTPTEITKDLSGEITLERNTMYALCLSYDDGGAPGGVYIKTDAAASNGYPGGELLYDLGAGWEEVGNDPRSCTFAILGSGDYLLLNLSGTVKQAVLKEL